MTDDEPLPNSILNQIAGFDSSRLKKVETKESPVIPPNSSLI